MKTLILARVSTEEQREAGNSLPAQIERLKNYCKNKKLEIVRIFSFDESAYKTKRDEFDKALDYLKNKKEKFIVCFDKVDRFSRNVFDKRVSSLYEMAMQDKIELHFASDNLVITSNISAVEKFHFGINLGLAKYYSDAISDNVKRANENRIKKGEWIAKAPVGYLNILNKDKTKDIVPDPKKAHLIIKIFEMYGTGNYSIRQVQEEMKNTTLRGPEANKPLSIGMIHGVLSNPFYSGKMKIKGKLYNHKYQTLIDKELFERCQNIMKGYHKKPFQYAAKPMVFRGLIKCANPKCGCTISGETHKGHTYYSCTNYKRIHDKRVYVREEDLLRPIYKILDNIKLSDEKIKDVVEDLKNLNQNKNSFHKKELSNLRAEHDRIDNRISKIFDLMADENISKEAFNTKLKEYTEKQNDINQRLENYINANESFYITAEAVLNLAKKAREIFDNSEPQEKRRLLNFLLQNCELDEKNLKFELKTPFDTVLQASKCSSLLCSVVQNQEFEHKFKIFWAFRMTLLGLLIIARNYT